MKNIPTDSDEAPKVLVRLLQTGQIHEDRAVEMVTELCHKFYNAGYSQARRDNGLMDSVHELFEREISLSKKEIRG